MEEEARIKSFCFRCRRHAAALCSCRAAYVLHKLFIALLLLSVDSILFCDKKTNRNGLNVRTLCKSCLRLLMNIFLHSADSRVISCDIDLI